MKPSAMWILKLTWDAWGCRLRARGCRLQAARGVAGGVSLEADHDAAADCERGEGGGAPQEVAEPLVLPVAVAGEEEVEQQAGAPPVQGEAKRVRSRPVWILLVRGSSPVWHTPRHSRREAPR